MSYFSRLSDIVTCNLTEILAGEDKPDEALRRIIAEMEEGLGGAQRSVTAAEAAMKRIREETDDHRQRVDFWVRQAKSALVGGDEEQARLALVRKQEIDDVVAGLEQQFEAAQATFEHLSTTRRALEARLAEARRKLHRLETGATPAVDDDPEDPEEAPGKLESLDAQRARKIEEELEALRKELQ